MLEPSGFQSVGDASPHRGMPHSGNAQMPAESVDMSREIRTMLGDFVGVMGAQLQEANTQILADMSQEIENLRQRATRASSPSQHQQQQQQQQHQHQARAAQPPWLDGVAQPHRSDGARHSNVPFYREGPILRPHSAFPVPAYPDGRPSRPCSALVADQMAGRVPPMTFGPTGVTRTLTFEDLRKEWKRELKQELWDLRESLMRDLPEALMKPFQDGKMTPLITDQHGGKRLSPSMFDRDAYGNALSTLMEDVNTMKTEMQGVRWGVETILEQTMPHGFADGFLGVPNLIEKGEMPPTLHVDPATLKGVDNSIEMGAVASEVSTSNKRQKSVKLVEERQDSKPGFEQLLTPKGRKAQRASMASLASAATVGQSSAPLVFTPGETVAVTGAVKAARLFGDREKQDVVKLEYDVANFYYSHGYIQWIARHERFANLTMAAICLNAIYIGIDRDWNDAEKLYSAHPVFIISENLFCSYFSFEILVRYFAFEDKTNCLRDFWFKFDSVLVTLMVGETWILPLFLAGVDLDLTFVRLIRLLRLSRMARLIRMFPELMTMIKGAAMAWRAMSASLVAIILLLYIFAIVLNTMLKNTTSDLEPYFGSLPLTMWTLTMDGLFQDSPGVVAGIMMYQTEPYVATISITIFVIFTMFSALMVLNMLIGAQCEVVSKVAIEEKERADLELMRSTMLVMLKNLDADGSGEIDKDELLALLENSHAIDTMETLTIDPIYLVNYMMMFYEEKEALTIRFIMETMLQVRGERPMTMQDFICGQNYMLWALSRQQMAQAGATSSVANS
jgi:hypothetical protein